MLLFKRNRSGEVLGGRREAGQVLGATLGYVYYWSKTKPTL